VQEDDEQTKTLLEPSEQNLALTTEVRGFAGIAVQDHEQNEELLELSRRTLILTEEVHKSSGTGQPGTGEVEQSSGT
jgi:hypothetical protein